MQLVKKQRNVDPLIRIARRGDIGFPKKSLTRAITIVGAIVLSILFLLIVSSKNPFEAIGIMFEGSAWGRNGKKFFAFVQEGTILLGIAIALAPAYKMKFWNVGAQGQLLMGALGAAVVMIYGNALPNVVIIILALLAALVGGMIWGVIPAFFKTRFNTNETLFTLMMNYIAIQLVAFCTENWRGDNSSMGMINMVSEKGWLPEINNNPVILPLIVVLVLMVGMFFYIKRSKQGYEIQVIGESINTARYAGIKVERSIIRTMAISSALCGLMGFFYVCGFDHTIASTTSGGYGFTAIIVCWLSEFNPFLMPVFSYLISFLTKGARNLSDSAFSSNLNEYSCETIILFIILSIMLSEFFIRYRLIFRKKVVINESEEIEENNTKEEGFTSDIKEETVITVEKNNEDINKKSIDEKYFDGKTFIIRTSEPIDTEHLDEYFEREKEKAIESYLKEIEGGQNHE